MRNPYLIQVAEERNTHMLFEETAEICSAAISGNGYVEAQIMKASRR